MKKIELTETELRALIFWAKVGVENSNGGSYPSVINTIERHSNLMRNKNDFNNLRFGSRLIRLNKSEAPDFKD